MTATTELNGTIVQLEALYNSYNTILDQAKEQLETIDLDDTSRKRIVEDLAKDTDLQKQLSEQLFRNVQAKILNGNEEVLNTYAQSRFVEIITEKIYDKLVLRLDSYLKEIVDQVFTSDYIEQQLKLKIDKNEQLSSALTSRDQMRTALKALLAD